MSNCPVRYDQFGRCQSRPVETDGYRCYQRRDKRSPPSVGETHKIHTSSIEAGRDDIDPHRTFRQEGQRPVQKHPSLKSTRPNWVGPPGFTPLGENRLGPGESEAAIPSFSVRLGLEESPHIFFLSELRSTLRAELSSKRHGPPATWTRFDRCPD